ncbi:dihydrofolate reductase [Lysinibacillus alkalisoli]|uniref:Dihydrofolate reductase n=1 Tax=Lysinibacillus alkalisoli TaxID=1911548 RepID=A0A917FY97_9BACI|nr:type 3 dihydrofolate reductase [Lysinibacillus alkalisoli]GGG13955.1 dihydrofolate reductase [Lysinibacillus alkalisoli]
MISLIVAHDNNRVIGHQNKMPWHLPGDLQYFKKQTLGKPVIMGRKTFESIGKPLPERRNIVITRDKFYDAEGVALASSLEEALKLAGNVDEIMVIGGEQIFTQALPLAERIYVTKINHEFEGDTHFPTYKDFHKVSEQAPITADEGFTFTYAVYEK